MKSKPTKTAAQLLVQIDNLIEDIKNNPQSDEPLKRLFNALPQKSQDTLRSILAATNGRT